MKLKKVILLIIAFVFILNTCSYVCAVSNTNTKESNDDRKAISKIEFTMELNPKYGEVPTFNGKLIGEEKDLLEAEEYWVSNYGKSTKYAWISSNEEHNQWIKEDEELYGESYANPVFLDKFEDGEYKYELEISVKDSSKYKITENTKFIINGNELQIDKNSEYGISYRSKIYKLGNYVSDEVEKTQNNNAFNVVNNMIKNNNMSGIEVYTQNVYDKALEEKETLLINIEKQKLLMRDVKEEDSKKITAIMTDDEKIIDYYEVNVLLCTEKYGDIAKVNELSEEIEVSLPIPSNLPKLENGKERKFYVIRIHDGKTEKIEAKNNNDGTITFKSDKFSTYTTIYEDVKSAFKLGDVNQDGKINSLDATAILKHVSKKKLLTEEQLSLADVTKDGKVNSLDAVRILKFVAKKITEF